MLRAALFAAGLALAILPAGANANPVLFISIDGLRPGDVLEAEKRGLQIPNLRRFLKEGAYASGVVGVLPTITYPSHTTLLTGASPARHGIVGNTTFDPMQINASGWYWYARDIKVQTLWEAADKAGLKTANVHWPVSVGAKGVTWNLPQIWRSGHADDAKLVMALSTPGLTEQLERELGEPYAAGMSESIDGDEKRGRFAVRLIADEKPDFATVYLTALDHEQHVEGPGSKEAHAVLERIDAIVGKLVTAEQAAHPDAVIAVASDHGFEAISSETNFFRAFIDAGLITLDQEGKVTGWEAMPWNSGGSVAVVLARKDDAALAQRVRALLEQLKANPQTGIAAIIDHDAVAKAGGNPDASFYVNLVAGTTSGLFKGATAPLVSAPHYKGMHGYFPASPNMRSTFLVMGPGIPSGRSLGEIDMRSIAPTLAKIMQAKLPEAELAPLDLNEIKR